MQSKMAMNCQKCNLNILTPNLKRAHFAKLKKLTGILLIHRAFPLLKPLINLYYQIIKAFEKISVAFLNKKKY